MHAPNSDLGDTLENLGRAVYLYVLSPVYRHGLDWIFPILGVVVLCIVGMMVWRSLTTPGRQLALKRPVLYQMLHGPLWTPMVLILGAVAVMGVARLCHASVHSTRWWAPPITAEIGTIKRMIGGSAFVLFLGVLVAMRRLIRENALNGQHGSAYWAARSDLKAAPQTGKDRWSWVLPIKVSWRGTAKAWTTFGGAMTLVTLLEAENVRHWLLVGASGSGKGFTVFSAIIASIRQPFILQDIKAECQGIDTLRALTGEMPIIWGCAAVGGWPSMKFNFLHHARNAEDPATECNTLASMLCPKQGNQNDFIAALAADVLTFIFRFSDAQTLADVGQAIEHEGLIPYVERLGATPGLLGRLNAKNMDGWATDSIQAALSPFSSGWGKEVTSGHDFELDDLFERGGYVLSAEPIQSRATPIKIFWGLLFQRMQTSNRARNLSLLLDEGLACGKLPNLAEALQTLRSKKCSIVFAVQNTAGILALYGPNEGKSIIDTFVNSIFLLNGLNTDDQKRLSMELGKRTVIEKGQAGVGSTRRRTQVGVDLLEVADCERRARSGDFWAVIRASKATRGGAPIIGKLTGSAGAGLVRHPSPQEVENLKAEYAEIPQPAPYTPPKAAEAPPTVPDEDSLGERDPVDDLDLLPERPDDFPPPPDDF